MCGRISYSASKRMGSAWSCVGSRGSGFTRTLCVEDLCRQDLVGQRSPHGHAMVPEMATRSRWRRVGQIVCWVLVGLSSLYALGRLFGLERTWYLVTLVSFTPYLALASLVP